MGRRRKEGCVRTRPGSSTYWGASGSSHLTSRWLRCTKWKCCELAGSMKRFLTLPCEALVGEKGGWSVDTCVLGVAWPRPAHPMVGQGEGGEGRSKVKGCAYHGEARTRVGYAAGWPEGLKHTTLLPACCWMRAGVRWEWNGWGVGRSEGRGRHILFATTSPLMTVAPLHCTITGGVDCIGHHLIPKDTPTTKKRPA